MINLSFSLAKSVSYSFIWLLFVLPSCVFSTDELLRRCNGTFSCGNQSGLFYPFWNTGREGCGHPDFKLECNTYSPELNIFKFRILEANSSFITLARSDFTDNLCPSYPSNALFNESVLQLAPGTEMLTIYYDCNRGFSAPASSFVGPLDCEDYGTDDKTNYFLTKNFSSSLPPQISSIFNQFRESCARNVSIPASRTALDTLESSNKNIDDLKKAFEQGFVLALNPNCPTCIHSGGACGYSEETKTFVCYGKNKGRVFAAKLGIGVAFAMVGLILIVVGLLCVIKCQRETSDHLAQQNLEALIPLKHYSYAQVKTISKSFVQVVGKGGFGTVYKGTLCDGRSVAVKILKDSKGNGEDFINEVASMSKTSHVNIVSLLGFCSEGSKRAIIYEYLENGSLDQYISKNTAMKMDWMEMYRIALGVARGLEYLHHGCKTRIVHFDIKPQNVLLDDNLCPKVSDFGLAKLCEKKESILSLLDTRGTIGYIAPEVCSRMYGRVSHKSDVYSYGMLVLEMIGAREKTSTENSASNPSSMYFPEWIYREFEKGDEGRLYDNGITCEEEEIAKKMKLVGLWCVQPSPSDRPSMSRVVEMMEGNLNALEIPPRPGLQIPAAPLAESSTLGEDISIYNEV